MSAHDEIALPANENAEQSVLGALMLKPESLPLIADWLPRAAFSQERHQVLFQAITELADRGEPCDAVTMGERLESQGLADLAGGTGYVLHLANTTPTAANIVAYAEIVAEKHRLRTAMQIGSELIAAAGARNADSTAIAGAVVQRLASLQSATLRGGLVPARTGVKRWFADLHAKYETGDVVTGVATPWANLNEATHGFQPGELVMLAGRPSMGKSIFGDSIAVHEAIRCAQAGRGQVALFALETTREKLVRRAVSRLASVPHDWLVAPRQGQDDEAWWPRLADAARTIAEARLLIDDTPRLTAPQICARARRAALQEDVTMVVVDHAHIVGIPGKNPVHEIGEVSAALKGLGKDLHCPVIALGQLNRAVEGRANRRPTMADLRGSGNLEQDADVILFVHREDYYDADTHLRGVVEMELAKGRDLRNGVKLYFRNEYEFMRASEWEGAIPQAPVPERPMRSGGSGGFKRITPGGFDRSQIDS